MVGVGGCWWWGWLAKMERDLAAARENERQDPVTVTWTPITKMTVTKGRALNSNAGEIHDAL